MTINRFNSQSFANSEWYPSDQIEEVDMTMTFPAAYSGLAPVVRKIDKLVSEASGVGDGKLNEAGLAMLAGYFDEAAELASGDIATALRLKAKALREGHSDAIIRALNDLDDDLSFVGGNISSWYGKRPGGFATCFASQTNRALNQTCAAAGGFEHALVDYLGTINKRLSLSETPKYVVSDLVFMAGEGGDHPKHIAYFLPEDEGFKNSPIKKTHYFSNVHQEQINKISADLLTRFASSTYDNIDTSSLGALGVLSHEYGHFIQLPETDFRQASKWNRWSSIMYQEIAADVFGFLILAEVWGPLMGHPLHHSCTYYLGEMLRYVNRGFGKFPDSDGMLFQLNYLREFSAIEMSDDGKTLQMNDPQLVVAAMRSLARCLSDSLLANDCELLAAFDVKYGVHSKATAQLEPFLRGLNERPTPSLAYRIQGI